MKLYIPTCTLNFNNIFATASISPKIFYSRRGFGNKRYYDVKPNNREGFVTLYSRIPYFEIDTDLENYPMVIEIDSNDYPSNHFTSVGKKDAVEIFVCEKTIYFNPFHSYVFFFDYAAQQNTLTKAQQSLENKFAQLYQNNMLVKRVSKRSWFGKIKDALVDNDEDYFTWDDSFVIDLRNFNTNSDFTEDVIIDRIRGFVYCYTIGAQLSTSPEVGKLKSLARRMRNTLSAIVNSPDHRPTRSQDESITNDIREFNRIYSKIDDNSKANREIISSNLRGEEIGLSKEQIEQCLKLNDVFDAFCRRLNLRQEYNAFELMSCLEGFSPERYEQVVRNLQLAISRVETQGNKNKEKKAYSEMFDISELKVSITEQFNKKFYEELVNSLIRGAYIELMEQNGITENEPLGLAFCGGAILKRILGEQWDGSNTAQYINNLLSHLQSNEAFNLFSEQSEVLYSFAAFCQKGDNIDRLSEYLIQQGFSNYKLAYGLYGATRGFASLPKTFTKTLIDGDKTYLPDFICSLYKQIFDVTLSNPELPKESPSTITVESKIGATILQNINQIEGKAKKQEQLVRAISETAKLETAVQSPRAFMYILDSFPRIKNTNAYKRLKEARFEEDSNTYDSESFRQRIYSIIGQKDLKSQRERIDRAIELEAMRDNPEAFLKILDNFLSPSDAAYKRICALLEGSFDDRSVFPHNTEAKSSKAQKPDFRQPSLFPDGNQTMPYAANYNRHFAFDERAWSYIESVIPDRETRESLYKDWTWFIGEMRKAPSVRYQYYQNIDNTDDEHVIASFCSLKRGFNKNGKEKAPYFTEELRERIKERLLSIYCRK